MKNNQLKNIVVFKRDFGFIWDANFLHLFLLFLLVFLNLSNFKSNVLASTKTKLDNITIRGQIIASSGELKNLEGLDVVLLKYVLNNDGEVTPVGPQQRVKTKINGNYRFFNVSSDFQAGFQLGTRLEGNLYSSKIFFMKEGEASIEKNILIPRISYSVEKLKISKMSIVLESRLGKVLITEILVFSNSTLERIDTKKKPIEYKLPDGMNNFRMLSRNSKDVIKHYIADNVLKIGHIFQTGDNQIVYQYSLPARFGSLEMNREFDHPLDIVGIFTPVDRLDIRSDMIIFSGKQKIKETNFLTWKSTVSDSNRFKLKISNVPQSYFQYFIVSITLLFLFFCTVLLFFRKRLLKVNP